MDRLRALAIRHPDVIQALRSDPVLFLEATLLASQLDAAEGLLVGRM